MRIPSFGRSPDRDRELVAGIANFERARRHGGRVCGGHCNSLCPDCGSTSCACRCAPECPEAAKALSSEPARYPIEPGILPLVFAMKRTGIFDPCWSCEGHLLADGGVWKAPMVWFYSRSMVYLRLLGDSIARIKGSGGLGAPWKIMVTYSDPGNPDTTFSLQPSLEEARDVSLPALQADARAIARALEPVMGDCARALTS